MLQTVLNDLEGEMAWSQPPGNANTIGATYAHTVGVEDLYIHQIMQGKPLVWESGGWSKKLGRETTPNLWEGEGARPFDMFAFLSYRRAVYTASELYIAGLSDQDFDRAVPFPGREWSMSLAQLLALVVSHCSSHAGEIAALKGVMGAKGLPF